MKTAVKGTHMALKMPKEQRQKRRGAISVPVSYTDEGDSQEKKEVHDARTADFTEAGLGLYSHRELKPGAVLEVDCPDIWETPMKFSVKWCNKVSFNFYRIGLSALK